MIDNVAEMCRPRAHKSLTHSKGEEARVLADDKEVQEVTLCGGALHEIEMTEGERVCIHNDGCGCSRCARRLFLQLLQIVGEAPPPVFEKDNRVGHVRNLMKAEVAKEACRRSLRVEEDGGIAALLLDRHEVGEDFVQEPLALMFAINREAAQRVPAAAARGDDRTRVVEDGAGVVEVCIHAQVFLFEQGAYARHTRAVGWVDGRDHSSSYAWGSRGFPCSSSVIKARICGRAALCSV